MAGSITTFIEDVATPFLSGLTPCPPEATCSVTPGSIATGSLWAPQSIVALALQFAGMPREAAFDIVRSI